MVCLHCYHGNSPPHQTVVTKQPKDSYKKSPTQRTLTQKRKKREKVGKRKMILILTVTARIADVVERLVSVLVVLSVRVGRV